MKRLTYSNSMQKRRHRHKLILPLWCILLLVTSCGNLYTGDESLYDPNHQDNQGDQTQLPVMVAFSDPIYNVLTRGSGVLNPTDETNFGQRISDGTFFVYAFRRDNPNGMTYAHRRAEDTDRRYCLIDGSLDGITDEECAALGITAEQSKEHGKRAAYAGNGSFVNWKSSGYIPYYNLQEEFDAFNFFAYYYDNAKIGEVKREADRICFDVTVDGSQDLMCASAADLKTLIEDVENGKIGVCIMKDMTRWGRDYLQVGNAMEIFRRNNVRFIAVNNGIDSEKPDTLEFAPFINIMSEWYAKDISKKVKTGIRTKGASGKPIATEAPYGYMKDPNNKDFWIIDEEAAEVVRLIFRLFIGGKNRNQIAVYLKNEQILTPTFYLKQHDRGTAKSRPLNEENRYKWNKATLTKILTRQEYCGDVVNFKTTKHFRDKRNHYVDKSEWQITENVHEPIIDRADFETVQRILENAPVRRPNGDGEIHPLSGLMFCKDCGAKMHIRIDYRNGGKRHVAFCSEYHKGKAKNPKCNSPHIIDADLVMQTIADVLKKVAEYSISNREEFEALVRKNLDMQQTDKSKKQQKRIPQITTRLEQIDKVLNKLYEDNALGAIPQDRYEQMSQKYSEEYYTLKAELAELKEQLSAFEDAGGWAHKFLKLIERYAAFTDLTPAILNEFISRIEVHERDKKRAKQAVQHIGIYFSYIGKFENELTQLAEPTEEEIRQMREKIEEAQKEKSRAYHRNYSKEYRAKNLEKRREYERIKAREYRAKRKAQAAALPVS